MAELSVLSPKHALDTEASSEGGDSGHTPQLSNEKLECGLDSEAKARSKLAMLAVLTALFVSSELVLRLNTLQIFSEKAKINVALAHAVSGRSRPDNRSHSYSNYLLAITFSIRLFLDRRCLSAR